MKHQPMRRRLDHKRSPHLILTARRLSLFDFCSTVYVFVCLKYKYFIWKNVAPSRKTDVILHPFLNLFTTTTLLAPQGAVVGGSTVFRSVSRITIMSLSNRRGNLVLRKNVNLIIFSLLTTCLRD